MSIRGELARIIHSDSCPNSLEADCAEWIGPCIHAADAILARYAVVELSVLPDPDGDGQIFLADAELRIDTSGHSGPEILTQDGNQITPTQLRFFAAEYLAAANRAEAQS